MSKKVPQPDKQFLRESRLLKELAEKEDKSSAKQCHLLKGALKEKFVRAFGMMPDRLQLASRFIGRFINTAVAPEHGIFDHVEYFQRSGNLVILAQPYGIDEAEITEWAEGFGASCVIANDWTYHFPGRTSLFFVEFDPKAKAAMDKRVSGR